MTHAMHTTGVRFLAIGIDAFRVYRPDYPRFCNLLRRFACASTDLASLVVRKTKFVNKLSSIKIDHSVSSIRATLEPSVSLIQKIILSRMLALERMEFNRCLKWKFSLVETIALYELTNSRVRFLFVCGDFIAAKMLKVKYTDWYRHPQRRIIVPITPSLCLTRVQPPRTSRRRNSMQSNKFSSGTRCQDFVSRRTSKVLASFTLVSVLSQISNSFCNDRIELNMPGNLDVLRIWKDRFRKTDLSSLQ